MKFQVQTSFFNFDSRGNSKKINVGTLLTQKEYNNLTQSKKDKCSMVTVLPSGRVLYTRQELTELVNLYIDNDGHIEETRDQFVLNNPNTGHSPESIRSCVGQLRTMDINYPTDTRWDVKNLVAEVAQEIEPDRFGDPEDMKAYALQLKAEAILADLVG
tara:strand:- start:227 stop:703 length:477 start_codon:yes stop_codon:yes gene_type:complete